MFPPPLAIGLWLCDQVIVDRTTNKPSLIGIFTGLRVESFPSDPQRFFVLAALTNAVGRGRIVLEATYDETGDQIHLQSGDIYFPDRFTVVNASFRTRSIIFPATGQYTFSIAVDGETVALRRIRVYEGEEPP